MDFKELAKTKLGTDLIDFFEKVKDKIADVRFKPELDKQTRITVIEVLDEMIVGKLKVNQAAEKKEGNDSWN